MDTNVDVSEIRRRMLEIRSGLATEVQGIRHHARRLTDWHYYVARYPWASVAAAAVAGYLAIPKKPRVVQADAKTLAKLARQNHLVVQTVKDDRSQKNGVAAALSSVAFGLLAQMGKSYASGQIERFVKGASARHGHHTDDT
jgi:hypothetical protein